MVPVKWIRAPHAQTWVAAVMAQPLSDRSRSLLREKKNSRWLWLTLGVVVFPGDGFFLRQFSIVDKRPGIRARATEEGFLIRRDASRG